MNLHVTDEHSCAVLAGRGPPANCTPGTIHAMARGAPGPLGDQYEASRGVAGRASTPRAAEMCAGSTTAEAMEWGATGGGYSDQKEEEGRTDPGAPTRFDQRGGRRTSRVGEVSCRIHALQRRDWGWMEGGGVVGEGGRWVRASQDPVTCSRDGGG